MTEVLGQRVLGRLVEEQRREAVAENLGIAHEAINQGAPIPWGTRVQWAPERGRTRRT